MAKSNLTVRLLTAAVAVPLLLALLFIGPTWGFYVLVAAASVIGAAELFGMTHPGDRVAQGVGALMTLLLSAVVYFYVRDARFVLGAFLVSTLVGVLLPLWRLGQIETAAVRVMANVAGPIYVGAMLTTIALVHREQGSLGGQWVVMTLTFAWLGDTGGYFVGRFFGKHKLYEKVSPKKTREGFFGSLLGSCVGALVAHFWYLPVIPLWHALALAIVAGALGQLGDLVESLLKRSTGIKDSGWIIPGHGGLLDRIDALLIVSPIVWLYTQLFFSK